MFEGEFVLRCLRWAISVLNKWALFIDKEEKQRIDAADSYVEYCISKFQIILKSKGDINDEVSYAHEELKVAYDELLVNVGDVFTASELDIIKMSLMSARVYYHALKFGSVSDKDVVKEYEYRFQKYIRNEYSQEDFRQNSYEVMLRRLVKDGIILDDSNRERKIFELRQVCLEDVARIECIRLNNRTKRFQSIF